MSLFWLHRPIAALCTIFFTGLLPAQLIQNGAAVPKRDKPPVVFVNGYQQDCSGSSFTSTFGAANQVMQSNGEVSLFFDNCTISGRPSLENLGVAFGNYLAALKYDDGTAVNVVDVVAHSLGGLIVRSYLAGKQASGAFQPPATVQIRKLVFLATPHFGSGIASLFGTDAQTAELASGSKFLYDLATWNQGTDDLRGVDAMALIGNGGTGTSQLGLSVGPGLDDGVVATTSGSLGFTLPGRTRILPYCHIPGGGLITFAGLCSASAKGIAQLQSATDDNSRATISFLNGTSDWKSIGTAAEDDPMIAKNGGLDVAARGPDDTALKIDSVNAAPASGASKKLNVVDGATAYTDVIAAGPMTLTAQSGSTTLTGAFTLVGSAYRTVLLKTGPLITPGGIIPAASRTYPLSVAPGQFVSIYGQMLAGSTAAAASVNYPTLLADTQVFVNGAACHLTSVSPEQINFVVPTGVTGLAKLMVKNTAGSHTVNVLLDPAVPAIFTQNQSGSGPASALNATNNGVVTAANPLHAGEFLELFLTGLGATTNRAGLDVANLQPTVTISGAPCEVSYAGRAPGFEGLDQINCKVPAGLGANPSAQVVVVSGNRGSNIATLAVQ